MEHFTTIKGFEVINPKTNETISPFDETLKEAHKAARDWHGQTGETYEIRSADMDVYLDNEDLKELRGSDDIIARYDAENPQGIAIGEQPEYSAMIERGKEIQAKLEYEHYREMTTDPTLTADEQNAARLSAYAIKEDFPDLIPKNRDRELNREPDSPPDPPHNGGAAAKAVEPEPLKDANANDQRAAKQAARLRSALVNEKRTRGRGDFGIGD